jgi:hypothetical protein
MTRDEFMYRQLLSWVLDAWSAAVAFEDSPNEQFGRFEHALEMLVGLVDDEFVERTSRLLRRLSSDRSMPANDVSDLYREVEGLVIATLETGDQFVASRAEMLRSYRGPALPWREPEERVG